MRDQAAAARAGTRAQINDVVGALDGVVVVLHDRDLMRMAGDPRRIADITFAEARRLDLGRRTGPEFAGERIPAPVAAKAALNLTLKEPKPERIFGNMAGAPAARV